VAAIGGILLVITLIAICLALLRMAPCLGAMLTIVCLPAAVRTAINARHYARLGERMSIAEKSTDFALSFFIVLWAEILSAFTGLACAALLSVPLGAFFKSRVALGLALLPGTVLGFAALIGLLWMFRPGSPW
jgi:hypothetical protein